MPSTVYLSWEPPSSLDLSAADPDIAYCVDAYRTDITSHPHILRNCNVLEPHYNFSLVNPDPSELFTFIITPRSNMDGARNGIAATINASFSYHRKLNIILY